MLVKSARTNQHVTYLEEIFDVLRRYHMKLNPLKCAFEVGFGKFLSFMVSNREIEANPEKIKALQDMKSPTRPKEVQRLTGCVAALNRFISKATDKCVPFFDTLKGSHHFEWTPRCEEAFQKLKEHLGMPPILSKPIPGDRLSLYLSVSEHAVSFVLIRNEEKVQLPVYYVSKRLLDAESRYFEMEQLAHALMFDIEYVPRAAIKGHVLADFLVEFSHRPTPATNEEVKVVEWKLYVDGASSEAESSADVMLISLEGHKITSAVRFKFKASNNEAEYEALIAGLRLASHLKIQRISIFSDSQLVVGQVKEEYQARNERMRAGTKRNTNGDALAKLASLKDSDILRVVPIEEVERSTIDEKVKALTIQTVEDWMTPLIQYLADTKLLDNKKEARRVKYIAA
ncbi:Retrovirus-related Pol polyprotein from transposon 412 [Morus notabilis]|uniref:Retrovirus-related Pol polyprotein from transposon 412 n=1 Tax=Morus notabilis TaxID=981085 RepID=W9SSV8_9ROSA|nr:Retrovirus-related Pol polyprotein from transposon 412 [Morus notabilis]